MEAVIPRFRANFSRGLCIEFQDILNQCKSVKSWFGVLQSLTSSAFPKAHEWPKHRRKRLPLLRRGAGLCFPVLVVDYRKRVRENFQLTSWPDHASLALRCYRQARPSRSDGPVVGRSYGGTLPVPATLVDREIRELLDYWAFALRTHMLALVVWFGLRRHCSAVQTCLITALGRHARSRLLDVTPMFGSPCSAAVDLSDCCRRLALDWVGWALGAVCPA